MKNLKWLSNLFKIVQLVSYGAKITQVCVMSETLLSKVSYCLLMHVRNSEEKNVMVWGKRVIESCIGKRKSAQVIFPPADIWQHLESFLAVTIYLVRESASGF